jgi:hypothetical protein
MQRLWDQPSIKAGGDYSRLEEKSTYRIDLVNPKLKCHPNAQSRNVTFYLRRMQSSPRRSRACIEFSLKSKRARDVIVAQAHDFASAWLVRAAAG